MAERKSQRKRQFVPIQDDYGDLIRRLKSVLRQIERMTDGLDHTKTLPKPVQDKLNRLRADEERISRHIDAYHAEREREARAWLDAQR